MYTGYSVKESSSLLSIGSHTVTISNSSFENVTKFAYFGMKVINKNYIYDSGDWKCNDYFPSMFCAYT
jgi:hypothetical protein